MIRKSSYVAKLAWPSISLLLAVSVGCSQKPEAIPGKQKSDFVLKRLPPGAEFAGFLGDYSKLKPSPRFENTVFYVKQDDTKNIHKYVAIIVDPVEVYIATNADPTKMPDGGRTALAAYFQHAITRAVSDAFPMVREPGTLVLRLRSALVGVDVGGSLSADPKMPGVADALVREVDIGKVGVEMELVDSMTGEQIAAAVDRQNLGAGAVVGSVNFSRDEKFLAAKEAFDGWAARLREFLDSAQELSQVDQDRTDKSYQPYGEPPKGKR